MIWPARVCTIEITPTEVKAALVRHRGRSLKVISLVAQPIESVENEDARESAIRALQTLLDEHDLRADAYVASIPANVAVVRPLTIPFVGHRRVASAVKYEMEPVVPFPIEDLLVDSIPIRQNGKQSTDVLAIGVRTETVRFHLEVLEGVGLDPDVLSLDVIGLLNLYRSALDTLASTATETILVMHVRQNCSYFVAIENGLPVFLRAMNFGADALGGGQIVAAEEVLATVRSLMVTAGHDNFRELFVTGTELDQSVTDLITERLGIPVRSLRLSEKSPFVRWKKRLGPDLDTRFNRWEPLIGLAADSGQKGFARLNFRKEELAQTLFTPAVRRRAMFSAFLLSVLAVVGLLGMYMELNKLRIESASLDDEIYKVYKEAIPDGDLPKGYDVLTAMKQQIKNASADRIVAPFLGKQPAAVEVLSAMSGCVPADGSVEILRLDMLIDGTVRISGLAPDPSLPGKIKDNMAALDILGNVDIEHRKDVQKNGVKKVEFSIAGKLKQST